MVHAVRYALLMCLLLAAPTSTMVFSLHLVYLITAACISEKIKFGSMLARVIHEKSNLKCLTSSSVILFIIVMKYIMQNFSNFEKSLEGATSTSVSNFVHKVNEILEIKMFPAILSHL